MLCALMSGPASSQQPLSAIDWLSDSVDPPSQALPGADAEAPVTQSANPPKVTVTVLDAPSPDGLGLLSPDVTGLPRDLWSNSTIDRLSGLMRGRPRAVIPAIQDFHTQLMLAEADPPIDSSSEGALLLARIDAMLEHARLDAALALIEEAGPDTPELFRRYFDVTLLTGTENQACRILKTRPGVAPTYIARVFCLARSGDWSTAVLTLNTHRVLGDVTPEEEQLISRFLDPELFEDTEIPPPDQPTPLVFRIREAIGESQTTSDLPLAFAHADLRNISGWKFQLDAAERLARNNALPANTLQALFTSRTPSASGGVWDRVEAFQEFDVAMTARDPVSVARTLPDAWRAMQQIRAEHLLAELYADRLRSLPLQGEAERIASLLGLLSRDYEAVAREANQIPPNLQAIATGQVPQNGTTDPVAMAVLSAFDGAAPSEDLMRLADDNKLGEALLRAVDMFNAGTAGDLSSLTDALAFFRAVGLEDLARRAALQVLILDRPL